MKTNKFLKSTTLLLISLLLAFSCKDEDRITQSDTQDIGEEAETDTYFQDMDDMAGVAVQSDEATSTGRSAGGARAITTIQDDRFKCSGIVVTIEPSPNSTVQTPSGKITVDFGTTGCADLRGNVRKGKLIFTYNGKRFIPGSTVVTTGENYTINGIKLEGTRTLTNVTGSTADAPRFNIKLTNGKATFEDGSTATRVSDITTQWVRATNPLQDKLVVEQSSTASGKTRGGREYSVALLQSLEFKRACGIAVAGIKKYTIDGEKEITIDYGDGTCDRSVTITFNDITRTITVR